MNPRIYVGALDEATFTMSESENASYPLSNLSTYNASDQWRSSATTDGQTLKIDFGTARPRNFCIIENHNFSGLTTVSLQAADSSDYATNLTTVVTSLVGSANSPLKFEFTAVSKRYWRILFTTLGGTAPQLGQIFIDQKVEFTQSFDFGFRPKNEDFESVVRKVAMSGLERAAKTYSGRLRFEMGWNNVNNTTLELLRWWMQKVSGGFAPFWYFDELDYSFYVRCGKNFNPATVNAYKINGIATVSLQTVSVGQNPYTMQTSAMAVDLDGTEYATKSNPLNMDLNLSELLTNGGFETVTGTADDGVTDDFGTWTETGTAVKDSTATVHGGSKAVKIICAANFGDVRQSISLTAGAISQMTLEFWARGDGTLAGKYRVYDSTNSADVVAWTTTGVTGTSYTKVVKNFAVPATCTQLLIILGLEANQTGTIYYDDVSVRQAYNATAALWFKKSVTTGASDQHLLQLNAASSAALILRITATNNYLAADLTDGTTTVSVTGTAAVHDGNWHLAVVTITRTGNLVLYMDGAVVGSTSIATIGAFATASSLGLGHDGATGSKATALIGETQFERVYAMTAAQVLQIYNTTGILKAYDATNFPGINHISTWRFRGTSDSDFLKDESGYNNLTGTNVTQVLDQATATYRIAEL